MKKNIRTDILKKVAEYYERFHHKSGKFVPGKSRIPYAGRVYDSKELVNLVDSSLDFWLTAGRHAEELEKKFKAYFRSRDFLLVNSGSSANLLMVASLRSALLKNCLKAGDEVITPAVTFPTTLTPILQNNLIPVFVDVEDGTYNINPFIIEKASSKTKSPCLFAIDIIIFISQGLPRV